MTDETPRARWLPFLLMIALIAGMVCLRYEWRVLYGREWQVVHIIIGYLCCFTVLVSFHGWDVIRGIRKETWWILSTAIGLFCLYWYLGRTEAYSEYWSRYVPVGGPFGRIVAFFYFSVSGLICRTVVPLLFAWKILGKRPGELGLRSARNPHPPALSPIWPLYLALFVGLFPILLYIAKTQAAFQVKYPLNRGMISSDGSIPLHYFLIYELLYFLIFFSGESFWRGYLTFGTERDLGIYGIVLMCVPYITAHFGKPLPETLGAIAAGVTLGWLALKHRSIWIGVILHYAVALSMDLMSMRANGFWIDLR